ncbi:hypothetical protein ACCO45_002268 [Purpureocillium lilacinum]|uniref:Uncharacterized protein n=1 Tax=Purpureocillium lilacinum TaxID=33203 RepID=A0ACC4EBR6_PURLI
MLLPPRNRGESATGSGQNTQRDRVEAPGGVWQSRPPHLRFCLSESSTVEPIAAVSHTRVSVIGRRCLWARDTAESTASGQDNGDDVWTRSGTKRRLTAQPTPHEPSPPPSIEQSHTVTERRAITSSTTARCAAARFLGSRRGNDAVARPAAPLTQGRHKIPALTPHADGLTAPRPPTRPKP